MLMTEALSFNGADLANSSRTSSSSEKSTELDSAAIRLCKAVASHVEFSHRLDKARARKIVLTYARRFNRANPGTPRLKGLWNYLERVVRLNHSSAKSRCVDLTCGGVPHIAECHLCHNFEIAFCNNKDGSGQFAVNPNDPEGVVLGICRQCLPRNSKLKPTSHKSAEMRAEKVRAQHKRKALSLRKDQETHYTTPAQKKRSVRYDQRKQGRQEQQGH